ncbi:hypothetical protein MUK42_05120, partial [Musa troglodytarum]
LSPPPPDPPAALCLDRLFVPWRESDVLWTSVDPAPSLPETAKPSPTTFLSRRLTDRNFGILAALPEDEGGGVAAAAPPLLQRKPSISSSDSPSSSTTTAAGTIPRPKPEYSLSVPVGKVHRPQSLPVNVPVVPRRTTGLGAADGGGDEHEMMPPHEIVARTHGRGSRMTTFSVLEGAGRTPKGRDPRRVRDAVLSQTGFLN